MVDRTVVGVIVVVEDVSRLRSFASVLAIIALSVVVVLLMVELSTFDKF